MNKRYYENVDETLYHETLDNGLNVYIIKKEGFSNKCAYFATKFGSFNTGDILIEDGKEIKLIGGLAHFLEHRVFDYKKGNVVDIFYKLGADVNAFTSFDRTAYYFSCTDHFNECLELLLDFPTSFTMSKEAVENEKDIIVSELLMYKDDPDEKLFKGLLSCLYKDHPIIQDVGGEVEEVRATTYDLLKLVHNSFYSSNNMVLVICGDVDVEETLKIVKSKEFVNKELNIISKNIDKNLSVVNDKNVIIEEVNNKKMLLGYKLPPLNHLDNDKRLKVFTCLDLISSILYSSSSDFYNELINKKYVSSLGLDVMDYDDACIFIVEAELLKNEEEVLNKIVDRYNSALEVIDKQRLDSIKKKEISSLINGCDSITRLARNYLTYILDGNDFFSLIDVVKKITIEDLKEVFNIYMKDAKYAYSLLKGEKDD